MEKPDPAVFILRVKKERIFAYDETEQEFIIDMYPQAGPKRVLPMPIPSKPESFEETLARLSRTRPQIADESVGVLSAWARAKRPVLLCPPEDSL
jgi:hypothetical protein